MSEESLLSVRMAKMSDSELKNYTDNKDDFQEYAVLSALLELEKRGLKIDGAAKLKEELTALKTVETIEEIAAQEHTQTATTKVPELYSTSFIYIFGALFSVFGGGILMALNFMTLNNKKAARTTLFASLGYSILLTFLVDSLGTTNIIISLGTSLLGIYLLQNFIWNKETPSNINYKEKSIWKPIGIGLLIALPLAYLMIITGNFPQ